MDPNAALDEIRAMVRDALDNPELVDPADLAEAFVALDGWLTRGGALPEDWQ